MTGSWLIEPAKDGTVIGSELLPVDGPHADPWEARREAVGTTVSPGDVNLLVQLRLADGAERGTATGLAISQEADGRGYRDTTPEAIELETGDCT
ncbi:hypothetical protein ACQ3I4_09125 [Zafaria sp. Z1313]|uniref:hypothetical protein n=1 Tax=Zafaria sp. Z1313 TaxID=3423202 RepID=UPI003D30210B